MKKINVETKEKNYNIYIGENILSLVNSYLESYDKILILSNDMVLPFYKTKIEKELKFNNKVFFYALPEGEEYKNITSIMKTIDFMMEKSFSRKSLIISLGGGVVCDMGGFTASIFMRGIDFIQVPTSLLAQVDASVGGKTGVNHPMGKNSIGTFNQPIAVIIDVNFLDTLPKEEFLSGMGEVIKHGIIDDSGYLNFLETNYQSILNLDKNTLVEMVSTSCEIKKSIVEEDEKEKGVRAFLNLGHTYSHALENIFQYKNISHGEGVSKGIIFQFLLGERLGFNEKNERKRIEKVFEKFGIDSTPIFIPSEKLISIMKHDKKNNFNNINFVLKKKDGLIMKNICEKEIIDINEQLSLHNKRYIKAVIDIGTNSCRLLICEVKEDFKGNLEIVKKLHKETQITRLGKFVDSDNNITKEGMDKVIKILKNYKETADSYGASEIIGFATAATREAENKDVFLENILNESKIKIICISGELEAEFTFCGAISEFKEEIFLFDIGGGSTEIIFGNSEKINFLKSFKAGAIREAKNFFPDDNYERIDECVANLKDRFKEIEYLKDKDFTLVGVAGTVTTNVSVKEKMINYNSEKVHGYLLSKEDLKKNLKTFLSLNLEDRKKLDGLQPERAESVVSGTIITLTIMDIVGKDEIFISEWDNLEGAALKLRNN